MMVGLGGWKGQKAKLVIHDPNCEYPVIFSKCYLRMLLKILLGKNPLDGTWKKICPSFPHKGSLEHLYN